MPLPGHGRCEVICFSSDHTGSFAALDVAHARLVVEAWRHRTAELMARPEVEQVFCFENRGEEIGVTLTHPHGQIYGYPFLTPAPRPCSNRPISIENNTAATCLTTCWHAR
ncbi:galactose-1-phosphate uridyl transferase, N-terminal domain protein [Mycobacterium xenopi 3993]|nr:galactose-1-phosphate uridyl transferase, N-terminal domain protein [Mycobacterium xenopi 3993]